MIKNSIFVLMAGVFFVQPGFTSFEITPIIMTVAPSGSGASVTLTVTNTGDAKTPIQLSIFKRDPDIDGKEKYEDSKEISDSFQIIPSQFILKAKEKRSVRVTYVGDPKIKSEVALRLIAEEFPISITDPDRVKDKAVASISILSKYVTSLYVKPNIAAPDIFFEASESKDNKMVLLIHNKGTEHIVLKQTKYKVTTLSDKKEFQLPAESVQAIGSQNILAGKSRKFIIPWPKDIPTVPLRVSIESNEK